MTKKAESTQEGDKIIEICILTPTDRMKTVGYIIKSDFDDSKKAMFEVIRFLKQFSGCEDASKKSELVNDVIKNVINHDFEVGLITNYSMYRANSGKQIFSYPNAKTMIEEFVEAIGLANFSDYFQTKWGKLQPVAYHFGSTKFVVGENPNNPIDILIDLLDELDDRRSELGDEDILPEYRMASLRAVLNEWSPVALVLNELIRMSDVDDKLCSGYEFVHQLVNRIGLTNLSPKTSKLYTEIFLTN